MANRYGLSQQDENLLSSAKQDKSNFGLLPIDYAKAYVYGQSGENLVGTFIVPRESFLIDGEAIDINIGRHLRENGFTGGTYRVIYYFYRPIK